MKKLFRNAFLAVFMLLAFTSCENNSSIISNIEEREANIIVVMLESRGISATKTMQATTGAGNEGAPKYTITVPQSQTVDAIAFLNQNGFPRQTGTTLLKLFEKQGLMTTEKEETIRYQAGLSQQISNTIQMIDGVIEASVQLSFPKEATIPGQQVEKQRITAAVYVKHQGILEDPNAHLEDKIKRLVSGSVTGLDMNDVTVVSDRSRYTDYTISEVNEAMGAGQNEFVSIWNIVLSKNSAGAFRFLFFLLTFFLIVFAVGFAWLIWKVYPVVRKGKGGFKKLISPSPLEFAEEDSEETP